MFFFFNDTATTEIYTLSLHDALPIFGHLPVRVCAHEHDVFLRKLPVDPLGQARRAVAPIRGRPRAGTAIPVNGAEHVDPQLTHGSSWWSSRYEIEPKRHAPAPPC